VGTIENSAMTETQSKISRALSLADETFDAKQASGYTLNILLNPDSFSFCICGKKQLVMESFTFQNVHNYSMLAGVIERVVKESAFLGLAFGRVNVAMSNNKSTLVPEALFDASDKDNLLRFNHTLEGDEYTAVDSLKNLEAKNLFALPLCIETVMKKLFKNVSLHHHSSALIEGLLAANKNKPGKRMIVHVGFSQFDVIVLEGRSLLFYNSFRHQTSEDFIYYLLFVCEQLKLNPETIETVLLGEVEKSSTIYDIVYKYIRHVKFGGRPEGIEYSYKLNELPNHFYYNLFSLQTAGL